MAVTDIVTTAVNFVVSRVEHDGSGFKLFTANEFGPTDGRHHHIGAYKLFVEVLGSGMGYGDCRVSF